MFDNHETQPNDWVKLYADELFRYTRARVDGMTIAEDIVQETFLAALRALPNFEGRSSVRTWLYAILRRQIALYYRNKIKKGAPITFDATDEEATKQLFFKSKWDNEAVWADGQWPSIWNNSVTDSIEKEEFWRVFQGCLDKLSDTGKSVFAMKFVEEETSEFICKELDISSSNYWVIVHRAKLQLRQCLSKNWFE